MLAALLRSNGKIKAEEVETPICGADEILVKVMSCGVCGSDFRIFKHGNPRVKYPAIIGHEVAGIIFEKGKSVSKFNIGDRVAIGADVPCGNCEYCNSGYQNNCDENLAIGYQYPGGFAEFIKVGKNVWGEGPFHLISKDLDFDLATFSEPVACVINGFEILPNRDKNTIVVLGAGVMGVLFTQLAGFFGYKKVYLADIDKDKLSMAESLKLPVDGFFTSDGGLKGKILDVTGDRGADALVVACADLNAQKLAIGIAGKRGAVNFFGGLPQLAPELSLRSNDVHYKELFLTGSHGSNSAQHKRALDIVSTKRNEISKLISHRFLLKDIEKAFTENMQRFKIIINPHQQ